MFGVGLCYGYSALYISFPEDNINLEFKRLTFGNIFLTYPNVFSRLAVIKFSNCIFRVMIKSSVALIFATAVVNLTDKFIYYFPDLRIPDTCDS